MMGKWYKRNNDNYVINAQEDGSGYDVVSKEIDPWNSYDLQEVRTMCEAHPEQEVEWSEELNKYVLVNV